ncbi:hypothetical protein, partial [Escherichia coli]|uniref:hypothetical protein n=1 Tax=Escherichia coli TaxID=562 RepID=UPI00351492BF
MERNQIELNEWNGFNGMERIREQRMEQQQWNQNSMERDDDDDERIELSQQDSNVKLSNNDPSNKLI